MKMNFRKITTLALIAMGCVIMVQCGGGEGSLKETTSSSNEKKASSPLSEEDKALIAEVKKFITPLPPSSFAHDDPKVVLGKMLYFDTRLSKSNVLSCNSCHNLATYGVDNNPTSMGHGWVFGNRNSPTVLNAFLHETQFWDGRARNVEHQAGMPILNPIEMGMHDEDMALDRIASVAGYLDFFKAAFPNDENPKTYENIANAIGAFERTLVTPSRFDEFLEGNGSALNEQEKRGLKTFLNIGCTTCHTGPALGGNLMQKFGLVNGPYWDYTNSKVKDLGRYEVTKDEADKAVFKVPSLRNIANTYPYFHDGSVWDLGKAVEIMAITQLGKELSKEERDDIVAFLGSLTGTIPVEALTLPVLPPSPNITPKPIFN